MPDPNISIRKHIRILPNEPTEPTSTLVLTSYACHFVDIRILVSPTNPPSQVTSLPPTPATASLHLLDWAFAGINTVTKALPPIPGQPYRSTWSHWIDSKTDDPDVDEGMMYYKEGGDILEVGQSVNKDGSIRRYEELWGDVPVDLVGEEEEYVSIVLKVEDTDAGVRGCVVRVGQWCQGILKVAGEVTVERWTWVGGEWERVARLGMGELEGAIAVIFDAEHLRHGGRILVEGMEWDVVEVHRWK